MSSAMMLRGRKLDHYNMDTISYTRNSLVSANSYLPTYPVCHPAPPPLGSQNSCRIYNGVYCIVCFGLVYCVWYFFPWGLLSIAIYYGYTIMKPNRIVILKRISVDHTPIEAHHLQPSDSISNSAIGLNTLPSESSMPPGQTGPIASRTRSKTAKT